MHNNIINQSALVIWKYSNLEGEVSLRLRFLTEPNQI